MNHASNGGSNEILWPIHFFPTLQQMLVAAWGHYFQQLQYKKMFLLVCLR